MKSGFNFSAVLFSVFLSIIYPLDCKEELPKKVQYVKQLRHHVAEILCKRYGIKVEEYGANMRDQVDLIYIRFRIPHAVTQDEARRLILDSVDEFVMQANSSQLIKPYLKNVPFTPENVALLFVVYDGKYDAEHPNYVHVGFNRGELFYKTRNYRIQRGYIVEIRETYDEAKNLAEQHSNEV